MRVQLPADVRLPSGVAARGSAAGSGGTGVSGPIAGSIGSGWGVGTSSPLPGSDGVAGVGLGAVAPSNSPPSKISPPPACCSYGPRLITRGCVKP